MVEAIWNERGLEPIHDQIFPTACPRRENEDGFFFCLMLFCFCVFFVCPPEGGLGSSWLKRALKQRSPTTLIDVVLAVFSDYFSFFWGHRIVDREQSQ